MTARSTDPLFFLITAGRLFLIALFFSVFAAMLAAEPNRPFLWSDGIRKGNLFKDERLPYSFVAPDDMVFRIWKEGRFYRFEARSYRSETLQITMTQIALQRQLDLQQIRPELEQGCSEQPSRTIVTAGLLRIECRMQDSAEAPGWWFVYRQLELNSAIAGSRLLFIEVYSRIPLMFPEGLQVRSVRNSDQNF